MDKILCDKCGKEIKSNNDFIAVIQYCPKFPYSKFHTSCYGEFVKNRFFVVAPGGRGGSNNLVISGKNGTRMVILSAIVFILFTIILFTSIYPRIPHTAIANIFVGIFFLIGLAMVTMNILLRKYIYTKFEKKLK